MSEMSKITCQALCAKLGIVPPPGVLSIRIRGDAWGSTYVIRGNLVNPVEPEVTEVAGPTIFTPTSSPAPVKSLVDYFAASPAIHA